MKLFIGLGNPEKKYFTTRHNLGQQIILSYLSKHQLSVIHTPPQLKANVTRVGNNLLVTPTTYMNESGLSVSQIVNYYKIDLNNLYIIHDDLDLKVGDWKQQFDRGSAGHNGLNSIIEQLGTKAFNRIRVGISHPENPNIPIEDYVLKSFSPEEKPIISQVTDQIISEIDQLIAT